jgi:hypothetical protein
MSSQLAAASYIYIYYALKTKRKERRWWQRQLYTSKEVYSASSLLADLNFLSVSGLYKNFTGMSPSEFEFLINLIGEKISKKGTAFRKAISVQESLALRLRFLTRGDSYVSLQYLFKIYKHAISCIVPEVCDALVKKLKDYIQVRQILLCVVYEIILKLECNQNFYLNKFYRNTFIKIHAKLFYKHLHFSSEDVAGEMLSLGKL